MKTHLLQSVFILGIALAFAMPVSVEKAYAYHYWECEGHKLKWPGEEIRWRASDGSFPAGDRRRTALERADTLWNEAPGEFTFHNPPRWGDGSVGRWNGQNEAWFSNNEDVLDESDSICWWVTSCWCFLGCRGEIEETDIVFRNDLLLWSLLEGSWQTTIAYGGRWHPFQTAALHEMGHALGLGHENDTYNIMGQDWTHIELTAMGQIVCYAGEDAGNGEVFLYGEDDSGNDLGVTHWKYAGEAGEYSRHTLTWLLSEFGRGVDSEPIPGVPVLRRYEVRRGSRYQVEFTYENNGVDDFDDVDIGFYISTSDIITTIDRRISTTTMDLTRGTANTRRHTVTIPNDLVVGQTYWIGVIVDYTDDIDERNELNNQSWIPIEIVP